jgi:mannose-1-phosphate guanylyltransferase
MENQTESDTILVTGSNKTIGTALTDRGHRARKVDSIDRRWGMVLAGGDGVRLRELTRFVFGDDRPKQFCPLLGKDTLLQEARRRAERSISPNQILYPLTRAHQSYYIRELGDQPSQRIVQPCNKGTAPAILYTLLHIAKADADAVVAILPCDHYYSREDAFTSAFESAFTVAEARLGSVVLLGAQPNAPEVEYGWIEPGNAVVPGRGVFHVMRFHEKPSLPIAEHLLRSGCLWNTFVMVGHVNAFLDLALASVPGLLQVLRSAPLFSTSNGETRIPDRVYDQIDPVDFSRMVLSRGAGRLLTLPLGEVEWNDLGDPERVISTLLERRVELPIWAKLWRSARETKPSPAPRMSMRLAAERLSPASSLSHLEH